MSVREESEGLLGTPVFWEDIQKDLFELFGPSAKLGDAKTLRDIADAKGHISRIGVVENPWESSALAEKNGWPMKFVVKIGTALKQEDFFKELEADLGDKTFRSEEDANEMARKIKLLHNMECRLYEKFAHIPDLNLLKVYVSHQFTAENPVKGYLIMEFVENIADLRNDDYLGQETVLDVLRALARFHSLTSLFTEEERKSLESSHITNLFSPLFSVQFFELSMELTTSFLGEDSGDFVKRLRVNAAKLGEPEIIKKMDNLAEVIGMKRVLAHGDPWMCNVICIRIGSGKIAFRSLIDLQTAHFGCIGYDLARVFTSTLPYEERRERTSFYLDKYFEFLTSFWCRKEKLPFTRDQLTKACHAYLPITSYIVAISTTVYLREIGFKHSNNKEETKRILKEKVIGTIKTLEENMNYLVD